MPESPIPCPWRRQPSRTPCGPGVRPPQVTCRAIEREAMRQVTTFGSDLIPAALDTDVDEVPTCPDCSRVMTRNGTRTRKITTRHAESVTLTGGRYRCATGEAKISRPLSRWPGIEGDFRAYSVLSGDWQASTNDANRALGNGRWGDSDPLRNAPAKPGRGAASVSNQCQ